jgi:hypothetical protein
MGDFSNWKPITMKKVKAKEGAALAEPPLATEGIPPTHFLRRNVDPKI